MTSKKGLLGGTASITTASGGCLPDKKKLLEPLGDRNASVRYFCTGCGFLGELDEETAYRIVGENVELRGAYIECSSCSVCKGSKPEFENALLNNINAD